MKVQTNRKRGYETPRIEAAGFVTENGYAASGAPQPAKSFTLNVNTGGL